MNRAKKSADSSDDSDRDYVPPTKRSKSTNSADREDVSDSEERGAVTVEGDRIGSIWEDLKLHSSLPRYGTSESDKKSFERIALQQDTAGGNKAGSVPKKSRLSRLLRERSQKKQEKPASILNTSKEDWERLKTREQLSDELTNHNKDGFLQRQDFLTRCEQREHDTLLEARTRRKK